jgi:hypothetical protein
MQDRDVSAFLVFHTLWAAVPIVLLLLALAPGSKKAQLLFQGQFSVEATHQSAAIMSRLLARSRALRLTGAAIGLSIDPLLSLTGAHPPQLGLLYGLTGYLCGDVVATITPPVPSTGPRRASLSPRHPTDYLSWIALVTPITGVGLGLGAVLVYAIEPHRLEPTFTSSILAVIPAGIAAAASYAAIQIVVARRQPVTTSDLMALDDAFRARCAHGVAAAGGGVALFGAAMCLLEMGGVARPEWLHLGGEILALVVAMLAVSAWGYRSSAWQVRRSATS